MLSGTVVDARTQAPIAQVAVDILTADHRRLTSASTDPSGHYQTDGVPPGTYIINVRRNGYLAESHQGYDLHPGMSEMSFRLQPK